MIPKDEYRLTLETRGGTGTRHQASPAPRDTTHPDQKSRVVA
jgi:hypothetical protein